jgi:hypothetical protein
MTRPRGPPGEWFRLSTAAIMGGANAVLNCLLNSVSTSVEGDGRNGVRTCFARGVRGFLGTAFWVVGESLIC